MKGDKKQYIKKYKDTRQSDYATPFWKRIQVHGLKELRFTIWGDEDQGLWGGLHKSNHIVHTAFFIKLQCIWKKRHKDGEGSNTSPSSSRWSLCHIVNVEGASLFSSPTRWNSLRLWPSLVCRLYHRIRQGERFLQKYILEMTLHQIWTEVQSMTWSIL